MNTRAPHLSRLWPPALVLVCAFALACFRLASLDAWMHLAAGGWIAEHRALPATDPFSAGTLDIPWIYHEWLFGLSCHLVWKSLGFTGLTIIKSLWVGGLGLLVYWVARMRGAGPLTAALLAVTACLGARFRLNLRPHLFSYAAVLGTLLVIEHAKRGRPAVLVLLAPLQILWANTHGSFLLGPALLGAAAVEQVVRHVRARAAANSDRGMPLRPWLLAPVLAVLVCAVNPYGLEMLAVPARIGGMDAAGDLISEWRSPLAEDWLGVSGALLAGTLVAGALLLRRRRALPLLDTLVLLGFLALAVRAARFHALWSLVSAALLAGWLARLGVPAVLHRVPRAARVAISVLAVVAATVTAIRTHAFFRFGAGVDDILYPVGAARVIADLETPGNVANPYGFGGYLIWHVTPERKVLLDGRAELYEPTYLRGLMTGSPPTVWNDVAARPDVAVIVTMRTPSAAESLALSRGGWELVSWDDLTAIWLRDGEASRGDLERLRLRLPPPDSLQQAMQWPPGAIADLERLVESSPLHFDAAYWLGHARFAAGVEHHEAAAEAFREALRVRVDAGAYNDLAIVLQALGRNESAIEALRSAIDLRPDYAEALYNLANLLWDAGRRTQARTLYGRFLELAPPEWGRARATAAARTGQ